MTDAPRYRLVGYDIGTAPDENGGWVHWTDHEAEIARLTAERDAAIRAKDCFQRMTRAHWEALCAMRNSINEYIPMPNTDSGPLFSPEDGPIYADIAERVIADLAESRAYALALEQELRDRARLTAERDAEIARLTAERRMIISHATMGGTDGDGLSVNAVSVQITALRNELYQDGKSRAEKAEAERDAAMAGAVRVRPLVWAEVCERRSDEDPREEHTGGYEADCGFGAYVIDIGFGSDCYYWSVMSPDQFDIGSDFDNPEAAKAAAQADYDARILAAIQPDPEARQADLAKAWTMGRDAAAGRYSAGGGLQGDYPMWDFFGDAEKAIRALTPPADLAAKIGGE